MTITQKPYILIIVVFMNGIIKKQLVAGIFILLLGLFLSPKTYAASLQSISDTISNSRPSASAPLTSDQAGAATQITVFDNGSTYLASDSAVIYKDTGETTDASLNVASMSAQTGGNRNINISSAGGIAHAHHKGDAFIVNIPATHTIKFTTISPIPASGHIIISFPGAGSNIASPSASTFSFNNIASGQITTSANISCTWTITAPTLNCLLAGSLAASSTVTINIGCTAGTSSCTAFNSMLINPTKTTANICNNGQTTCTADIWKISIKTQDASALDLDTGSAKIATIEAVQVQATVEPTLTFTIAGVSDNTTTNTHNTNCTSNTDVTNAGINPTATSVNLGILAPGTISIEEQDLTVSTNGTQGYVITATSSGHFVNPASGFWIAGANTTTPGSGDVALTANDTPAPNFLTAGTPGFGIHPCGLRVTSGTWGTGTTGGGANAKYSNPYNSGTSGFYATLASYGAGAVANDVTTVEYAATIGANTPAGIYSNYFSYVATATF